MTAPTHTPAQVAAAAQAERERFRRLATDAARHVEIPEDASFAEAHGRLWGALAAAEAIHNLDPATTTDALADLLAQEREKGRREGIEWVFAEMEGRCANYLSDAERWTTKGIPNAAKLSLAKVGTLRQAINAIRALAGKEEGR